MLTPDEAVAGSPFLVRAQAMHPAGVEALEATFDGVTHRVPAAGNRAASLSLEITPTGTGVFTLTLVAVGRDGTRSPAQSTVVTVEAESPEATPRLDRATLERRVDDWVKQGFEPTRTYPRGILYAPASGDVPPS